MGFVVAHRAGNDLARLSEAEQLGVGLVEADLRLWRSHVEVRHLKTLGPIPILWDRWTLASSFAPRLRLGELLQRVAPKTSLLLDLKGRNLALASLVLAELPAERPVTVCARHWRLLEPFADRPFVRVVYSVGNRRQLHALLRRSDGLRLEGISIHERLLDADTIAQVRRLATVVMTWPVNSVQRANELLALGVDGLISDKLELAGALRS